MAPRKKVSLVIPCYNEESGIAPLTAALDSLFASKPEFDFEVVFVDDGSRDSTLARLIVVAAKDSRYHVVELTRNFGKEAALTAGLDCASGDAIIPFDADLQDPPEVIPELIHAWQEGAEVVLARRVDRSSDTWLKRKSAQWFYSVHNQFATVKIPENVGDFRLMDRIVIEAIKQLPEQHRFMKGLFAWVGFRTATVDYSRHPRVAGTSKFSGWRLWNFALEGITSFSAAPLKFWSYIGTFGALASMAYALFIVGRTIVQGVDIPGYASLLVATIFFGSLQLIGIGMLGEYIGRIYMESKRRPLYLVRKHHGASTAIRSGNDAKQ